MEDDGWETGDFGVSVDETGGTETVAAANGAPKVMPVEGAPVVLLVVVAAAAANGAPKVKPVEGAIEPATIVLLVLLVLFVVKGAPKVKPVPVPATGTAGALAPKTAVPVTVVVVPDPNTKPVAGVVVAVAATGAPNVKPGLPTAEEVEGAAVATVGAAEAGALGLGVSQQAHLA